MGFNRYYNMPSPCYLASVLLFQLHGDIVSHMQVLATRTPTVQNTKYLDPYQWSHISFSCLFSRQWCRDVASGIDRHLDITFGLHVVCVPFKLIYAHCTQGRDCSFTIIQTVVPISWHNTFLSYIKYKLKEHLKKLLVQPMVVGLSNLPITKKVQ